MTVKSKDVMSKKDTEQDDAPAMNEESTVFDNVTVLDTDNLNKAIMLSITPQEYVTFNDGGTFYVKINGKKVSCIYGVFSTIFKNSFDANESFYLFVETQGNICVVQVVSDKDTLTLFRSIDSIVQKVTAMKEFELLSKSLKDKIREQASMPKQKYEGYAENLRDFSTMRLMFNLCRDTYPPNIQNEAQAIISRIEDGASRDEAQDLNSRLSYLLIKTYYEDRPVKTYDEIIDILNRHLFGMDLLKQLIAEVVISIQFSHKASASILIIGSPGTGKTSIMKATAECLGIPYECVDCNGVDTVAMKGLVSSYGKAKAGKLMKACHKRGTTNILLGLEEIDKMIVSDDDNPYTSLIEMLGPEHRLHDEFVDVDIDLSNTVFMATCNRGSVPDYIKNRFEYIIHIDDYSIDDKVEIAKYYALPRLLSESGISEEQLKITDKALYRIACEYTHDEGAREMISSIRCLIRKVITGWSRGIYPNSFTVNEQFVCEKLSEYDNHKKHSIGY